MSGCAQRYLTHDALNGIYQATERDRRPRTARDYRQRFLAYLHDVQDEDLTLGIAMTDAKGDRSQAARPSRPTRTSTCTSSSAGRTASSSAAPRRSSPARPTCTNSWSCRAARMSEDDADFAVCCAVPVDAPGVTIVARPAGTAGRGGREILRPSTASRPAWSCSTTSSCRMERVFLAGETRGRRLPHDVTTRPIIAIPASARAPASAIC